MKRFVLVGALISVVFLAGCYSVSVGTKAAGVPGRNPDYEKWQTLLIYGLVPIATHHKISDICQDGVEAVRTYHSFLNGLVAALTFSIYTPVTLQVWCKGGKTVELEMDPAVLHNLRANLSPEDYEHLMKDIKEYRNLAELQ